MENEDRGGCSTCLFHLIVSLPLIIAYGFIAACYELFIRSGTKGNIIQLILLAIFILIFGWLGIVWYFVAYVIIGLLMVKPWKN